MAHGPPRPVIRAVMAARRKLLQLADAMVPAPVAMLERASGLQRTAMLHVATRWRIADRLASGPRRVDDLAAEIAVSSDALWRMLRTLAALGVFEILDDGRIGNNRLSEVLRHDAAPSIAAFVEFLGAGSSAQAWNDLEETVRTGRNAFQRVHGTSMWGYFATRPDDARLFDEAMTNVTSLEAPAIANGYPFSECSRWCDVAGGRGLLLVQILRAHPNVRGILFDAPTVVAGAEEVLRSEGCVDRVERVGGSFFERVPSDADGYILKNILHDWDDARAIEILKVCRSAMKPGMRLLIIEQLLDGNVPPAPVAMVDMQMMVLTDDGRQRTADEFAKLFRETGFRLHRVVPLSALPSVVEARAV